MIELITYMVNVIRVIGEDELYLVRDDVHCLIDAD